MYRVCYLYLMPLLSSPLRFALSDTCQPHAVIGKPALTIQATEDSAGRMADMALTIFVSGTSRSPSDEFSHRFTAFFQLHQSSGALQAADTSYCSQELQSPFLLIS